MLLGMRRLKKFFYLLVCLLLVTTALLYWFGSRQGREGVNWTRVPGVQFDADGIPTITGSDWKTIIETQGFVVASDRLWQMDLMRRSAAGTLSEWFGEKALAWDEERRREDWLMVADKAAAELPPDERLYCDAFAVGVNNFIDEQVRYWGVEYLLLGEKPAHWKCRDSLLILLSMAEDLSATIESEAVASVWRRFLPPSWEQFLYPQDHPWNKPLFNQQFRFKPSAAPVALKRAPIGPAEVKEPNVLDNFFPGSNGWVYRGPEGIYLANDPHLGSSVPQLWYAIRLRLGTEESVMGAALPGLPGVVIGRNSHIAWGFTNAGEDVDDLLEEEVSDDGLKYVARKVGITKVWKTIERRPYSIRVRGGDDKKGEALFTHRGPLGKRDNLGDKFYSRQWLAFQPGILRLPITAMMTSKDWESFNHAMDSFKAPAQAILFAQKDGGIGLRVSGLGVQRKRTGLVPQTALEGEWKGLEPVSQRPRIFFPAGEKPQYLSSANQRLWTHGWGEHWSSDLRQDRIANLLENQKNPSLQTNTAFQLDTQSRYHHLLLKWIGKHASAKNDAQKLLLRQMEDWDGVAASNERLFAQALYAQGMLSSLALGRIRRAYLPASSQGLPYQWHVHNAWELRLITESDTDPWNALGLDTPEVAQWVLEQIEKRAGSLTTYSRANRWRAQHPFARAVPVLGWFFKVDEHPQVGFDGVVRVERPYASASMRLVWDLRSPDGGLWGFPVGQSGHVLSKYYKNFRQRWFDASYLPVTPDQKSNRER
jgi:penicillin G amidase